MDQIRSRGTELPCKLREVEFVNEKTFSNEEFVWRRALRNNLKIIKGGGVASNIKMGKDTRHGRIAAFTAKCSDTRVCK